MTLRDYAMRIQQFFDCSSSCFALSLIYMDRLAQRHPSFTVEPLSCHKMLLTSMVVAAKFLDDKFFNNAFYAKVGGVSLHELNAMEAEFLKLLGFALHVNPQEFAAYCNLCRASAP